MIFQKLAEFYGVTADFLINEKDQFVADAMDKYGYRGRIQAQRIYRTQTQLAFGYGDIDITMASETGKGYLALRIWRIRAQSGCSLSRRNGGT